MLEVTTYAQTRAAMDRAHSERAAAFRSLWTWMFMARTPRTTPVAQPA